MAKPKITVVIDPNGKPEITVDGAKGAECLLLTAELESDLGTVTERRRTCDGKRVETKQHAKQGA